AVKQRHQHAPFHIDNISYFFFFSSRRRHTRFSRDWSSDVCSSDLRDADRDELAVVGAAVEVGAFGLHALLGERGHEVRLDLGGALRTRTGAFPVGVVAVVDEVAGVRRADHVEVQVERDVQLLFEGQALHVLGGADQAGLLGTPPREADRVLHVRGTAHAQGGFQQSGAPGAVVVDAGPFRDAVQVGTGHHDVVGAPGAGLGDDVAGGDALQPGLDV